MSSKNYISLNGLSSLQNELRHLHEVERPKVVDAVSWAASNGIDLKMAIIFMERKNCAK